MPIHVLKYCPVTTTPSRNAIPSLVSTAKMLHFGELKTFATTGLKIFPHIMRSWSKSKENI
jgi:hypothetical protein